MRERKPTKTYLLVIAQLVITVFFLYLTFRHTNLNILTFSLLHVNYWFLLLSLLPQVIGVYALALREKYLLRKLHVFHFNDLVKGVLINTVGNNIFPFRAGEFLKVYYWSKLSDKSYFALMSVAIVERMIDLFVLTILFCFSSKTLLYHLGLRTRWMISGGIIIIVPIIVLLFLDWKYKQQFSWHHRTKLILGEKISNYVNNWLNQIMHGLRVLRSGKDVLYTILFSFLYWLANGIGLYLTLLAFHLNFTMTQTIVVMLAMVLGVMIPSAPGYIGTLDYFAKMALVLYGINASVAASFAIVSHLFAIVPITIVGFIFLYPTIIRFSKRIVR